MESVEISHAPESLLHSVMPYEYPVNWDVLILLYQGNTSRFIE